MATERIIGIDFGTSTSFVKVKRYEGGKPVGGDRYETKAVVFDGNGSIAVPTVLQRTGEQYWFGYDADSPKPGGTVYRNFKVDLENSDAEKRELARSLTKQFFKYIYQKYDEQRQFFGDKTDTEKTLVSYPAKWSEGTARFMVEAAKEAGFQNVSGIDEATAAINTVMVQKADELLEKGYLKEGKPVTLMLIDMGAGTTDIAVCRYTAGNTPKNEIIATWPKADGDILFGGREVDEILCEYLTKKLRESGVIENAVQSFKTLKMGEIKAWKEYTVSDTLSRDGKVEYCTVLDGLYMMMGITPPHFTAIDRRAFEELTNAYLRKYARLVNGCIRHVQSILPGFKSSDISLVVLTGGHSQWYFAGNILAGRLNNLGEVDLPLLQSDKERVLRMARPQETVSIGLAYSQLKSARIIDGDEQYQTGMDYAANEEYEKAAKCFLSAAEQGNARAELALGGLYFNGWGVEKDEEKGEFWMRRSADQGYAEAQYMLGLMYEECKEDMEQATIWFCKAAEQGYTEAQYMLGLLYDNHYEDAKKAVFWYRKAAEQGHAEAQFNMGVSYQNGQGIELNNEKAAEWFKKSAAQGIAEAQNNLGSCYYKGKGVPLDFNKAVEWYRKSAEQGNDTAQYNLGMCYKDGEGVEKNYDKAISWLEKAAEQGHSGAAEQISEVKGAKLGAKVRRILTGF